MTRTTSRVRLNAWNKAVVQRIKRHGTLSLNEAIPVKGRSMGLLEELNLPLLLYVGGYPGGVYHPDSGVTGGFHGAIQRVCAFVSIEMWWDTICAATLNHLLCGKQTETLITLK